MARDAIREQYFPVLKSDEQETVAKLELNVGVQRAERKFIPYHHLQLFVSDAVTVEKNSGGPGGRRDGHERFRFGGGHARRQPERRRRRKEGRFGSGSDVG